MAADRRIGGPDSGEVAGHPVGDHRWTPRLAMGESRISPNTGESVKPWLSMTKIDPFGMAWMLPRHPGLLLPPRKGGTT